MRRYLATALACVAVIGLTACASKHATTSSTTPSAPRVEAGEDCHADRTGGAAVYFGEDSSGYLAGVRFGTGRVGIIFGHQAGSSACDWMRDAQQLAQKGYSTLAFDFDSYPASTKTDSTLPQDINDAISFFKANGVTSIVLVGSSMGGTAVLAAAPDSPLPVKAVIVLSPPAVYAQGSADATTAIGRITVPLLLAVGDGDTSIYPDVEALAAAAIGSSHKQFLVEKTAAHGHDLMALSVVANAVDHYLATYAPPSPA